MNSADAHGVATYYDAFWSGERERFYRPEPALWSLIENTVVEGSDCLDVGCGSGNSYAVFVARRAASYVGVDVSANAVKAAQELGLDARVIEDAAELPFENETFDVALCIEVLEHLFAPHQAAAEIHRVLRPGGRLVASVPNLAYWRMRANAVFGRWNPLGDELAIEQPWRDPHIRFFTPAIMRRMLGMAGFLQVEVGAHGGRFLDHVTSRPTAFGTSRVYQLAERRVPSLFGLTIHAVATK